MEAERSSEALAVCPVCKRRVREVNLSLATGRVCCERCHVRAAPPGDGTLHHRRRVSASQAKPKPTPSVEFYGRVKDGLERLTSSTVFSLCDGTRRMLAYCPLCRQGTITAQILDGADEPLVAITSGGRPGCSQGCSEEQIAGVLFS